MEAYPLHWPVGYQRTIDRERSLFKQGMEAAQRFLREEIRRLKAEDLIISTNIPVRKDGGMYTDYMNRKLPDPGVAVYFKYKGKDISMCCDKYQTVWENIYALGKGIEALRGMERWGVSDFLDRAFTGFTALPESTTSAIRAWWDVLGVKRQAPTAEVISAYRTLAKKLHPDVPGTGDDIKFRELKAAYDQALKTNL